MISAAGSPRRLIAEAGTTSRSPTTSIELVAAVGAFGAPLVLVSPEVGLTVIPATAAGRRFADELGVVNQRIADCCERVVLVIAGQPIWVKPPLTASS